MIKSLKEKIAIHRNITVLFYIFVMYRMVLNLLYSTEQEYQIPKDLFFFYASLWFMLLVFVLRKIQFKRIEVWMTIGIGGAMTVVCFWIKNISPYTYGVDYFRIVLFSWIMIVLFIALIIELISSKREMKGFRPNWVLLLLFGLVVLIVAYYDRGKAIPIICPIAGLLMTKITKEEWEKLVNCFAIGYYLAFVQVMTKSLIQNPNRYWDRRYLGSFSQLETGGMFCGGAIICMLYFIALFAISEKKKWYNIVIPIVLITYPIYAVVRISARSTQISVLFVLFLFVVFIHKSTTFKTTIVRLAIAVGAGIVFVVALYAWSNSINLRVQNAEEVELSYWEAHLLYLTSEDGREGRFGNMPILNAIDKLSSMRLSHASEGAKQITFLGHEVIPFYGEPPSGAYGTSPHNYYVLWLIEYGILGGGITILWMLYVGIGSGNGVLTHDRSSILTFLWFGFCVGIFMFTCIRWKSPISYGLLILQYSLIFRESKVKKMEI